MRDKFVIVFALLIFNSGIVAAAPSGIHYVGGASVGYNSFSFDKKIEQQLTFKSVEGFTTVLFRGFMLSLNTSMSLKDSDVSEAGATGSASRFDSNVLAGYQINPSITLFAGYKGGKTEISYRSRDGVSQPGCRVNSVGTYEEIFLQKGPYLGGSYTLNLKKSGKLSASLAYARLKSVNTFACGGDGTNTGDNIALSDIDGSASADADSGYSAALTWGMSITPRLIYQTKLKINYYQQKLVSNGKVFPISQKFIIYNTGLIFVW
ncbi:MAG: hypothetical protein OEM38_06965 [Gammaproteobacteria bacterium]|nr:hypothetical protein [Gammaproteobacteria bacterium]